MTRHAFRLTTAAALCVFVLSCAAVSLHAQDAAETAARALAGEFKSVASAKSGDMQGQHLVVLTCAFDTTTLYITVAFDSAAKVSGLIITPQPPPL